MKPAPDRPSWRKPTGILLILLLIAGWAGAIVTLMEWLPHLPWPLQAILYIVAGIVWILPLRPLLIWMETGRWSAPKG